ncbi:class I SAM-dependent methyltransferase [Bacillus albus]|uniref:class I SAM-dependent methyltransferase n=1 Tax=Bacillus cereus group TaxID=86661 RepID=UPI0022DF5E43|nr:MULTISPECIES: class I SAM-dependent methyltransferase [Bacillus cereus group]MDA2028777.1 class I SAM-dependent methyltransferase [Bacillus cereus group sp. Bcc03]MDA2216561.1 class I SAM-dependent methyltransferase [Bacillus cereus group sp. Bc228]MDA2228121.1 class I SAM-dependent methyltransferase [Bacillus cereus group sp. Bc227]MDA2262856.1 class I SAM-dependent methyltransferase [Bacillus cereus group sp. Bc200]MDA2322418.1 class I SAM-dependent methyltransferase [Bacillus cereus grou
MIVTTAGRTNKEMTDYAKQVAAKLNGSFVKRNDIPVHKLHEQYEQDVLVVGKNRLAIYPRGTEESFFFHPNSAMFRVKRLMRGEHDPFVQAAQLESGMTVLDCTLGMASDSIVASYIVGKSGKVTGLEGNEYMAYIMENGLKTWSSSVSEIDEAMQRIDVKQTEHYAFLTQCEDNSYDVVYLDPMFEETVIESDGIKGLKHFALYHDITDETIAEAKRVARKRVVLKDHFRSSRFEKHNFHVYKRKSAKFHFGVIDPC